MEQIGLFILGPTFFSLWSCFVGGEDAKVFGNMGGCLYKGQVYREFAIRAVKYYIFHPRKYEPPIFSIKL